MHLDDILREVTEAKATDVYLIPGAIPCMSIDGRYIPVRLAQGKRLPAEAAESFCRQMMTEAQWEEFQERKELNMAYMAEKTDRFRVNALHQRGSIGIVARRVVGDIPTMRSLGLPPQLRDVAVAENGIALVTGSTGSGKSTTLASMIEYRNNLLPGHIVTIEDPVEFVYHHKRSIVTQREVGIDTLTFDEALRNTLRQAPQVILIGELRDADTVKFAMHAAETGHLVLATLHSTNAILAIERILNFYPSSMKEQILIQLSLNLKAIICQRLVRRPNGGRVAAVELLMNSPRVQDLIAKGDMSSLKEALQTDRTGTSISFERALFKLAKRNLISKEDALQAADSANDLEIRFKGIGLDNDSRWEELDDPWAEIPGEFDLPDSLINNPKYQDAHAMGNYSNTSAPPLPKKPIQRPPQARRDAYGPTPSGPPPRRDPRDTGPAREPRDTGPPRRAPHPQQQQQQRPPQMGGPTPPTAPPVPQRQGSPQQRIPPPQSAAPAHQQGRPQPHPSVQGSPPSPVPPPRGREEETQKQRRATFPVGKPEEDFDELD